MRRGVVISLVVLGVLAVVLMVTVAWNGSKLDETRQESDDLQLEVDDLRQEVDTLTTERDDLQSKLDEQLKTIEQLKNKTGASTPADSSAASPSPSQAAP